MAEHDDEDGLSLVERLGLRPEDTASAVLARLIDEVRNENIDTVSAYNRFYNRHNRSISKPWIPPMAKHNCPRCRKVMTFPDDFPEGLYRCPDCAGCVRLMWRESPSGRESVIRAVGEIEAGLERREGPADG